MFLTSPFRVQLKRHLECAVSLIEPFKILIGQNGAVQKTAHCALVYSIVDHRVEIIDPSIGIQSVRLSMIKKAPKTTTSSTGTKCSRDS